LRAARHNVALWSQAIEIPYGSSSLAMPIEKSHTTAILSSFAPDLHSKLRKSLESFFSTTQNQARHVFEMKFRND
jgi:hypothetical protein